MVKENQVVLNSIKLELDWSDLYPEMMRPLDLFFNEWPDE